MEKSNKIAEEVKILFEDTNSNKRKKTALNKILKTVTDDFIPLDPSRDSLDDLRRNAYDDLSTFMGMLVELSVKTKSLLCFIDWCGYTRNLSSLPDAISYIEKSIKPDESVYSKELLDILGEFKGKCLLLVSYRKIPLTVTAGTADSLDKICTMAYQLAISTKNMLQVNDCNEILVNDREYAGVCNAYMADFLDSVKSFGEMAC